LTFHMFPGDDTHSLTATYLDGINDLGGSHQKGHMNRKYQVAFISNAD